MNIINEQREEVIRENNTAQQYIDNLLNSLTRRTEILHIKDALHGDIDFSGIFNSGFQFINTIILQEGEITSIRNIPERVHTLICPKNLLVSLDGLPTTITNLEIPYNYLTTYNFSNTPKLITFNVEHNHIESLENFSPDLTEIYIQHNKLSHLDLRGLTNLKTLNISNNPITIIENLPENIVDFIMDNTPSIEFRNSITIPDIEPDKSEEESIQQNINFVDALDKYFQLKQKYESQLYYARKNAFNSVKSKKEGKRKALEVKPKCLKCNRAVGTIFDRKDERYTAICGDAQQPCNLNIELFYGSYSDLSETLYLFKEEVDDLKDNIIKQKLDTLFSYVSEATSIKQFKKTIESFNFDSKLYEDLLKKYNENHFNETKIELINKKKEHIFKLVEQIRILLKEYEETENRELLKTAVNLQVNTLLPETRNLRLLENELMEITQLKHSNGKVENFLFKKDVVLSKENYTFGEAPRVIKFQGV
jgi:hypothetical protein